MKKTTIYFDEATERRLIGMSERHGRSRAALIREAVDKLLTEDERPPRRPRALGSSGHSDTSERVDDLLGQGFGT